MAPTRPMRQIAVRADAGPAIGYGHVRRTLTVLERLRAMTDIQPVYFMLPPSDARLVESAGGAVIRLADPQIETFIKGAEAIQGPVILDSYLLTADDLAKTHRAGLCCAVFDDGRRLDRYAASMVIDYAPGADKLNYRGLTNTLFCLGPEFFPVRRDFIGQPPPSKCRNDGYRIVVTLGGSDPADQTARLLRLLVDRPHPWRITALLGPGYRGRAEEVAAHHNLIELHRDPANIAPLLSGADLAVSGAGGAALELAYLGIPTLLLVLSADQRRIAEALEKNQAAINLGRCEQVSDDEIWNTLTALASNPAKRGQMSAAGRKLLDGRGAERIARHILGIWDQHAVCS